MGTCKLLGKPNRLWGNHMRWTSIPSRGVEIPQKKVGCGSYEPVGSKASFLFFFFSNEFITYQENTNNTFKQNLESTFFFVVFLQ